MGFCYLHLQQTFDYFRVVLHDATTFGKYKVSLSFGNEFLFVFKKKIAYV